jgi:exopolyphosphatase / guanosine-5'-triphosphate,3'-diphosphate pyrophosphatase
LTSDPVAAIDCGTNSLRLLISDGRADLVRRTEIVRLGEGVAGTGRLTQQALDRARTVLTEYAAVLDAHRARRVRMVATSATRDATNRDDFIAMVQNVLGITPEVISGDEEAALSFTGALAGLPDLGPAAGAPTACCIYSGAETVLVVDVGGGSTELILGLAEGVGACSVDIGSVRLTERHLHDDPPTTAQITAVRREITAAIAGVSKRVPIDRAATVIGVAGTVVSLAAVALGLDDLMAVHGRHIPAQRIKETTDRLLNMTTRERLAIPAIPPGRADVIPAGALIVEAVVNATRVDELVASVHDSLDGIVLGLVTGRSPQA